MQPLSGFVSGAKVERLFSGRSSAFVAVVMIALSFAIIGVIGSLFCQKIF
jgi:hypothetical protein